MVPEAKRGHWGAALKGFDIEDGNDGDGNDGNDCGDDNDGANDDKHV